MTVTVTLASCAVGVLQADEPADKAAAKPERSRVVPSHADFDQWVFGEWIAGGGAMTRDRAEHRLNSLLESTMIFIDQLCGLSETQAAKLRLAGRGDIKQFFNQVDQKRRTFLAIRNDPGKVQGFVEGLRPLQEAWVSEPFLDNSLFSKTLRRTLSEKQLARLDKALAEMKRTEQHELIQAFVEQEGRFLTLNDDQRLRFRELLMKETRPSRRLRPYRHWGLLVQVSMIPESKLKPIFDKSQWDRFHRELEVAKRVAPNVFDAQLFLSRRQRGKQERSLVGGGTVVVQTEVHIVIL